MNHNPDTTLPAWYQIPLVWMIIAIPLSSVLVGFILLWVAISSNDGLVFDDYHQQGKKINRVLERDAMASSLGIGAILELLPDSNSLKLSLSSQKELNFPDKLSIRFLHPTRAGEDIHLISKRTGPGEYRSKFSRPGPGKWIVQLETNEWRINGFARIPGSNLFRLEAQ